MKINLNFPSVREKQCVYAKIENKHDIIDLSMNYPLVFQTLKGTKKKVLYDKVDEVQGCYIGKSDIAIEEGEFLVTDIWEVCDNLISLKRHVNCIKAQESTGIRLTSEFRYKDSKAISFHDYQFIVPGSFYNKNDTDEDGIDDYLGTYNQDYKDDRNPSLSVMGYCPISSNFISLIRADIPKKDVTITREQIQRRQFIHDTDIGSLGFAPSDISMQEIILRSDYPFCERASFCLNVDGSEWAAYKKVESGTEISMSYLLFVGDAQSLTEAGWKTTLLQMNRILNDRVELPFTLEEASECRRELICNSYREFPNHEGNPAGFFIHFSPREGYGSQNILEYGFAGQQIMLSLSMLKSAEKYNNPEYKDKAVKTIEYFVNYCIDASGLPNAMYSIDNNEFVYWWTGILYPFQYSRDRKTLEKYLGNQITESLIAISEELSKVKGNYCRTMIDSMYYLMLSYLHELSNGVNHENWLNSVTKFCDKMLELQNENGSWNRAYSMKGEPLTKPAEWFGASEMEQNSGVIFPAALMVELYKHTMNNKYMNAAIKAANYIKDTYVKGITYIGGLNDTTHIKSVKIDAVGVMFAMRTMLVVYEQVKDPELLVGARDAARVLATWTYLWDIPFDNSTTLGKHGFKTTGWAGCDVIPACSYVDDEFVEFVPDLLRVAEYCKDEKLVTLARIVTRGMHHGLSMPQNMYGYKMAGVQCEGYMTSLWLADTEYTEFSGAAAKNKGDDNDTCNGLVNAQALLNLYSIQERYGTLDFDNILRLMKE